MNNNEEGSQVALFIIEATAHIMTLHKKCDTLIRVNEAHVKTLESVLLRIRALENENAKLKKEFEQLSLLN